MEETGLIDNVGRGLGVEVESIVRRERSYMSILNSIKSALGISISSTDFDEAVLLAINGAISTLSQLGVGPADGFVVDDEYVEWNDYLEGGSDTENAKRYINLKVKLDFDPPQSSYLVDSLTRQLQEAEWRLMVKADPPVEEEEVEEE